MRRQTTANLHCIMLATHFEVSLPVNFHCLNRQVDLETSHSVQTWKQNVMHYINMIRNCLVILPAIMINTSNNFLTELHDISNNFSSV